MYRKVFNGLICFETISDNQDNGGDHIGCNHKNCGTTEKVWLPYVHQGRECGLKAHPYCVECGLIKNLSSDRPRSIGYYINLIASLSKEFKVAQVQMRLAAKEMERCGLDDRYGIDRYQQEKLFMDIVKRFLNVPEKAVSRLLEV